MKLKIFFSLLVLILIISCKTQKNKIQRPEDVLLKFLQHLQNLEFEEAKKYATESTINILNIMQSMVSLMPQASKPNQSEIIVYRCVDEEPYATCYIRMNQKDQTMRMIKIDGKWLVDMKKEDFQPPRLQIQIPDVR